MNKIETLHGCDQEMRFLLKDYNYRCSFCHGEGLQSKKEAALTPDDYKFLFAIGEKKFIYYLMRGKIFYISDSCIFRKD